MKFSNLLFKLLMLLAASLLGLTATIVNYLYKDGFRIQDLTNVQYGFAVIIIWLIVLPTIRNQKVPRGKTLCFLAGTAVSGACAIYFYFQSLTMLPVSLSIILLFQFSWIITLIDIIVKKKIPGFEKVAGMIMILFGTFFAVGLTSVNLINIPVSGVALGLLAALCFAVSLYLPEYINNDSSVAFRSAITITISAVVIHILYPPTYLTSGVLFKDGFLWWGILMALIGQVIPLLFMLISIPRIGGRMAGILGSIELPATIFFALIILKEEITWIRILGVLLILIGIFMSEAMNERNELVLEG
ncbi:drug/metabolite transporter (DMT)-like permease [Neobacillus niacini]|uniref:EamA family transporter n=1 Tax=Neobacillus driksii TaxID=3035913 RepID=UPI00278A7FE7|nr:DMT family transporter [Neobacillus niacini]MDQ0971181.1 drug/metabolite transporter (DMT)-like permease [Neobacillus niacini]